MEKTLTLTLKRKPATTIEDLSAELIQEILSRLPIKSLFVSRGVCPSWRDLAKEPRLANMHFAQISQNQNPGLILQTLEFKVFAVPEDCETCDEAIELRTLPFKTWLPRFKLVGSCNGILCFSNTRYLYRIIFVCNPVTGEYMKLPDSDILGKVNGVFFGFGFDPERKQYKVVRVRYADNRDKGKLELEVHTLGTHSWRSIANQSTLFQWKSGCPAVLAVGNLHWLGLDRSDGLESIVAVDVRDEKLHLIEPPLAVVGRKRDCTRLGSLGGSLSLIDDFYTAFANVWVMKDYGMPESWTKLFVIKRPVMHNLTAGPMSTLGMQKDGKILVACRKSALFLYDPQSKSFKDLKIHGLPILFDTFPYVPNFVSLKDAFIRESQ